MMYVNKLIGVSEPKVCETLQVKYQYTHTRFSRILNIFCVGSVILTGVNAKFLSHE